MFKRVNETNCTIRAIYFEAYMVASANLPSIKELMRIMQPCSSPSMMSSAQDREHQPSSAPCRAAVSSPVSTPHT